jgi:glycosyltransferase involved in cell wall biosynthesis
MKILLICESLKIGGIERLTLDQAYELSGMQINSDILILGRPMTDETSTFQKNELNMILDKKIKIINIPGSRIKQLFQLRKLIAQKNYDRIISHSLRGSVLAWICRLQSKKHFKLITTLHQLSTLSAPIQRTRRYLYSLFTDKLYIFSVAAMRDWNYNSKNLFNFIFCGQKKLEVLRNGVFIPRILEAQIDLDNSSTKPNRLIFVGRLTAWKGLEIFLNLAKLEKFQDFDILLVTPTSPELYLAEVKPELINRITSLVGKSIQEIEFKKGDLHLYPASYGKNAKFTEGISINVLEMACLGIPSLISEGGSDPAGTEQTTEQPAEQAPAEGQ